MSFQIIDFNSSLWKNLYNKIPNSKKDIFFSSEFLCSCQKTLYKDHKIKAAIYSFDNKIILYPFVKREFVLDKFTKFYDITCIYGRGGIISNLLEGDKLLEDFHLNFIDYCKKEKIINSFDRFHPIIGNHKFSNQLTNIELIQDFIVLDLDDSFININNNFEYRHKKSISKAIRNNIEIFIEEDLKHLDDFLFIYKDMLNYQNADRFYYFEKKFYIALDDYLKNNFFFAYAKYNNKIISCELILHNNYYAHSYLGATLIDYKNLCPNHLLKSNIINHLVDMRCKYYLLGGGINNNDGIYEYKKGFAPKGIYNSYIGKAIYDDKLYNNLKKEYDKSGVNLNKLQFYEN